jgi:hypothetical protein
VATDWAKIRADRGWNTPFTNVKNAGTRDRINRTQIALDNGEIDDPAFVKLMDGLARAVEVEDIGDVYYSPVARLSQGKKGGYKPADKIYLEKEAEFHGGGDSNSTLRSIIAQEQFKRNGNTRFNLQAIEPNIERITRLLQEEVDPASIKEIGKAGNRGNRTDEQFAGIAASLLGDTDRGYNRQTGIAFNGMNLNGGHLIAHSADSSLSNDPLNIIMQNAYMNKIQGAGPEKAAKKLNRPATDEELANGLMKGYINKILNDAVLLTDGMQKNSKRYNEVMSAINAKLV